MENRVSIADFAVNKSLRELLAYVEGSVALDKCQCPQHPVGITCCPLDMFVPGEILVERYTKELFINLHKLSTRREIVFYQEHTVFGEA